MAKPSESDDGSAESSLEEVDLAFARLEKAEDAMARFRRLERAFDKEDKEKGAI
jgi:hypothetical protein